jgi:hypothetical protein
VLYKQFLVNFSTLEELPRDEGDRKRSSTWVALGPRKSSAMRCRDSWPWSTCSSTCSIMSADFAESEMESGQRLWQVDQLITKCEAFTQCFLHTLCRFIAACARSLTHTIRTANFETGCLCSAYRTCLPGFMWVQRAKEIVKYGKHLS